LTFEDRFWTAEPTLCGVEHDQDQAVHGSPSQRRDDELPDAGKRVETD
jgi:hypothetical protein